MQRIRIKFTKGPEVKFISHLDMIRCFERSIRRADIPITYSSGFNPRPHISWGTPLQLGIESDCELADLDIEGWLKPNALMEALNAALPKGFRILEATIGDPKGRSIDSLINRAQYLVDVDAEDIESLKDRAENILKRETIEVIKDAKVTNKRPLLHGLTIKEGPVQIMILSEVGQRGTLKPKEILDLLGGVKVKKIKRTALFVA